MSTKERNTNGFNYNCFSNYTLYNYRFKIKELEKNTYSSNEWVFFPATHS